MNEPLDRELRDFLQAGPERGPVEGLERALAAAHRSSQRSRWVFPERWVPVQVSMQRAVVPRAPIAFIVIVLVLVAALAVVLVAGPRTPKLPSPLGNAANGLIADDTADGRLWVMRSDGSDARVVSQPGEVACCSAWSTDGTRIAYYAFPATKLVDPNEPAIGNSPQNPVGSVVVMNADGSHRRVLAAGLALSTGFLPSPVWSHDSTRVAFAYTGSPDGESTDVYTFDGTRVAEFGGVDTPAWSPDDRRLAFRRPTVGVFVADATGGAIAKVSQMGGSGFAFALPSWSPDGRLIAYYGGTDGGHEIQILAVDGRSDHTVPPLPAAEEYWPVWSPDGRTLAFERVIDAYNNVNLSLVDADGSNRRDLVSQPLAAMPLQWSPDGQSLVIQGPDQANAANYDDVFVPVAPGGAIRSINGPTGSGFFGMLSWQRVAP
jgi:Tol biopolymer transport system component